MTLRAVVTLVCVTAIQGVPLHAQQPVSGEAALNELREIKALLRALVSNVQAPQPPQQAPAPLLPVAPVSIDGVPVKGDAQSPLVIIEYADFQCPYCGEFTRRTLPALLEQYVATGKARIAFKNLPLQEIHPQAMKAAEAAECAWRQDKFWPVHDVLFSEQQLDDVNITAAANAANLDLGLFRECLQGAGALKVRQDLSVARSQGFNVTPMFLLGRNQGNGLVKVERVVTGLKDAAYFGAILDSMLNGAASH